MTADRPASPLDEAFLSVWRQALVDSAQEVSLAGNTYRVHRTAKRRLAQVDFKFAGLPYRGLEQNPETTSPWAQLARKGAKVMQFLSNGRYLAVVAESKITHYTPSRKT
jgi:hypothetical protein